jgi:DASS family divalent anion:Na+ symporter
MNKKLVQVLIIAGLGLGIWFAPVPQGLKPQAWHVFAIFVATIASFMMRPVPAGASALFAVTLAAATGTLKIGESLAGFSNSTIWMIVAAFLFSKAFQKTGLGKRIAYRIMKKIGDSTLKLAYAFAFSNLVMSPTVPSATARGGGIIFPIMRSLCSAFDSEPDNPQSARRMGAFLMQSGYQTDTVVCAMFMTSMAANPMVALFAKQTLNIEISWTTWILGSSVPGMLTLLAIPFILFKISPPTVTQTPEAPTIAQQELAKMGPMSYSEKMASVIFIVCLSLWATADFTKVNSTVVALMGAVVMVLTQVLTWDDVLGEKGAWDTMIWMGTIVNLAGFLSSTGFIPWFAKSVSSSLVGISWVTVLILLVIIYCYSHYGFASMTAHVTAMYVPFISLAAVAGAPPYLAALSLGYMSSLYGGLTHYSGGNAPIYFGPGYVSQTEWWKNGFLISLVNLFVFIGLGSIWWKIIGLW